MCGKEKGIKMRIQNNVSQYNNNSTKLGFKGMLKVSVPAGSNLNNVSVADIGSNFCEVLKHYVDSPNRTFNFHLSGDDSSIIQRLAKKMGITDYTYKEGEFTPEEFEKFAYPDDESSFFDSAVD